MNIKEYFKNLRFSPAHHLGGGDIRLTIGQQEEIETELTAMRTALSQVATNLGNGSVVSPDAGVEFMTRDLPNEVRLYCEKLRSELAAMTKERDELTTGSFDISALYQAEREKVAKLRKVANHSPNCAKALAVWKECDCGLDETLEATK